MLIIRVERYMRQAHNLKIRGSNPLPPQPIIMERIEILIFIFVILTIFYLVIYWSSGGKKKSSQSPEIKNYIFGVRILISLIAIVSFFLWMFF